MQGTKYISLLLFCTLMSTRILLYAQGTAYLVKAGPDTGIVSGAVFIGLSSHLTATANTTTILLGGTHGATEGVWTGLTGATQSAYTLTKTASNGWGNAGAASCDKLNSMENGWISYRVDNLGNKLAFGLSNTIPDANFDSIKYAVMLDAGHVYVYNLGQLMGDFGAVAIGDSIHIERIADMLFYTKNKIVFFNQEVDVKESLIIDVAIHTQGATFTVNSSFAHIPNCQNLNFTVPNSICVGLPASFPNTSTVCNGNPAFMRNFGDGSPDSPSPLHVFTTAGTYEVKLYIPTSTNCQGNSITKTVSVTNCTPHCATCENLQFYFPDKICVGEKIAFINGATGCSGNTNFVWNFGDGTPVSSTSTHTYAHAGTNTVNLSIPVADTCSGKNISKTITVVDCSELGCNSLVNPCDVFSAILTGPFITVPTATQPVSNWIFTVNVSGGASAFQYSWGLSSNLTALTPLSTTTSSNTNTLKTALPVSGSSFVVFVNITDSNGCTITKSITFSQS